MKKAIQMNKANENHLEQIVYCSMDHLEDKYRAGYNEHGGNLLNLSEPELIMEIKNELSDLMVYIYTLEKRLNDQN